MGELIAIAIGGAIGAVGRYSFSVGAEKLAVLHFPLATFLVNVIGSLLIGFFWGYFERYHISHEFRLFLFTGFLGGFTTFSTFARESVQFFKAGEVFHGLSYILFSNIIAMAFVALGFMIAGKFVR